MDYLKLFEENNMLDGGANFRCWYYRQGGSTQLACKNRYPILFVLQGALDMRFKYSRCAASRGNLVAINADALIEYRPDPETIVLGYRPPPRLSSYLCRCGQTYDTVFSDVVSITPPLQRWIDTLLEQHMQGQQRPNEEAYEQRRELARILMTYPPQQLGELYTAFSACALGDCERCLQEQTPTPGSPTCLESFAKR